MAPYAEEGCKLFVYGINESVSNSELQSEFEKFGTVTDTYNTGKGYAFVTYNNKDSASEATEALNGATILGQQWVCNSVVAMVIGVYTFFRFYLYSCYMQFRLLTIAKLHNSSFPMPIHKLDVLEDECHEEVRGTGLTSGPCRPSDAQIEETCQHLPPGQPEPGAGKLLAKKTLDLDIDGAACYRGKAVHGGGVMEKMFDNMALGNEDVCELRNHVAPYDLTIFAILLALMLSTCCCRIGGNEFIRMRKRAFQSKQAGALRSAMQAMKNQQASGSQPMPVARK